MTGTPSYTFFYFYLIILRDAILALTGKASLNTQADFLIGPLLGYTHICILIEPPSLLFMFLFLTGKDGIAEFVVARNHKERLLAFKNFPVIIGYHRLKNEFKK